MVIAAPALTAADVRDALADVADPEIPAISIVDLGMVGRAEVDDGGIHVALLPTFVGCPAIEMIQASVRERLAAFGRPVDVEVSFETPWTSERISPAGRAKLKESGFAPPTDDLAAVECPYCDSPNVAMSSTFGPTLCRALFYCRACRQPFEAFKPI